MQRVQCRRLLVGIKHPAARLRGVSSSSGMQNSPFIVATLGILAGSNTIGCQSACTSTAFSSRYNGGLTNPTATFSASTTAWSAVMPASDMSAQKTARTPLTSSKDPAPLKESDNLTRNTLYLFL